MNDDIPLEAPPVDDEQLGGGGSAPQAPAPAAPAAPGKPAKPAPKAGASAGKTTNGLPPIGDIELKKKSGTYNTYTIRLSYGQIECIRQALEKDHASQISDELKALLDYYLQSLPGPGEEEEDIKARDEQAAIASGQQTQTDGDASEIPMPPGDKGNGQVTTAGEGPDDGIGLEAPPADELGGGDVGGGDLPPGRNLYQGAGGGGESDMPQDQGGHLPFHDGDEADEHLPHPPAE